MTGNTGDFLRESHGIPSGMRIMSNRILAPIMLSVPERKVDEACFDVTPDRLGLTSVSFVFTCDWVI